MDKEPPTVSKKEWLHRPLETCSTLAYNPAQGIHLENALLASVSLFWTMWSRDWRVPHIFSHHLTSPEGKLVNQPLSIFILQNIVIWMPTFPWEAFFSTSLTFSLKMNLNLKFQITSLKLVLIIVTPEKRCCINVILPEIMARKKVAKSSVLLGSLTYHCMSNYVFNKFCSIY